MQRADVQPSRCTCPIPGAGAVTAARRNAIAGLSERQAREREHVEIAAPRQAVETRRGRCGAPSGRQSSGRGLVRLIDEAALLVPEDERAAWMAGAKANELTAAPRKRGPFSGANGITGEGAIHQAVGYQPRLSASISRAAARPPTHGPLDRERPRPVVPAGAVKDATGSASIGARTKCRGQRPS